MFRSYELRLSRDDKTATFIDSSGRDPTPEEQRVVEQDDAWFDAHPGREFRVREAMLGDFAGETADPRARVMVRTVVRLPDGRGIRAGVLFLPIALEDTSTDAGCRAIWHRLMARNPWFNEKGLQVLRKGVIPDIANAQS